MKLTDIKKIALEAGIKTGKLKKNEIIHKIQIKENNTPCFDTGVKDCVHRDCTWWDDCMKE